MNEKRTALLTVCLLGAFLLTFSLWAYLKPDDAFSQSERRKLTQKPSCTVKSIYSGRYMSDFETYAPDQFPLREQFRTLKSLTSLYLLRQRDTNGVYLAEGYVSRLEYPMQEDSIAHAARRFDYLYDTYLSGTNCRLYLSVIPDKGYFMAPSSGRPSMDYDALVSQLRESTPYMTYIDLFDLLTIDDYYRTDAHWRQERLEPVARRIAAHSAAQDAVFNDVDAEFVEKMGLWTVQTQCDSKDTYLTRPDLGRKLSPEAVETIKAKCKKNPTVQIYVADGLSSAAVAANIGDLLPAIMQGLESYKIDVGTPFFVKYGRVGVMDEISELTGATVTCTLIGERPGLITAESMSAYIAYKATVGMPEARRTVVSNIHRNGTIPAEAGAHIADIIKIMLEKKASGTDLKL